MTWLASIPTRLIGYALALAFAVGGWWMYARTARAWATEKAAAEAQADLVREGNRSKAQAAAADYRAARAVNTARRADDAPRLRKALQRPIPCPPAASAPDLGDVLVPADAVRVLIDASRGADGPAAP